uniref:Uncharacterized protein n=1 Tax=Arundo donax TaxID=35708 RepID=A0A0A9DSQ3_ARUDO
MFKELKRILYSKRVVLLNHKSFIKTNLRFSG